MSQVSLQDLQKLTKAYNFSAQKHTKQRRKDKDANPYINHPIEVAKILTDSDIVDIDTIIAGILHDTIEDTNTTYEEIIENFGENIAKIVMECSDDKKLDKITRKQLQIVHAGEISSEARMVKLADKLSNCHNMINNPPCQWSKAEIYGYIYWSYAVCQKLKGINIKLDNKLDDMFKNFGINLNPDDLQCLLEQYYDAIKSK